MSGHVVAKVGPPGSNSLRGLTVEALGLFTLYSAITIAFFWSSIPHLNAALIGPPEDNMNDFWNTFYTAVGPHGDSFFFTNLIRFPEGTSLYYHTFAYPKIFAVALLSKILGTDLPTLLLLHNLSLLVSFPLAAMGAFYLIRHLTSSSGGALAAGYVFGFNPSHLEHALHHLGVASIELIPFFVLTYILAIEKRSVRWLACAIPLFALSALLHWYYLFYLAYFVAFHTAYQMIRSRTLPRGWILAVPLVCFAGVVLALSPVLLPMVRLAVENATVYSAPTRAHVADLAAYFAFPQSHALSRLSEGVYWRLTGNVWESTVYLGAANLTLIGWMLFRADGRDRSLLMYAFAGFLFFCILASGEWLHVLGHRTIPMPSWLFSDLPFLRNVRGPSRAIVFSYLFLSILVGHAWALAVRGWAESRYRLGITAIATLILFDFFPAKNLPTTLVSCPSGLSIIRDDPERDFGVLNLPSGKPALYVEGQAYMMLQACHRRPIAQGNTARDVAQTLRDRLETRDLESQKRQLVEARVKYIVVNRPVGDLYPWDDHDGALEEYLQTYSVVYDGPDIIVMRVY